jgi:hypothetical protein
MASNRVFYACLGVSRCDGGFIPGVTSAIFSLDQESKPIYSLENPDPVASLKSLPQINFSYSEHFTSFKDLQDEDGVNEVVGWDLTVGSETDEILNGISAIRASNCLLSSVDYSLSVDSPFSVTRSYTGFIKTTGSAVSGSESEAKVKYRPSLNLNACTLPDIFSSSVLQKININMNINRENIMEPFTMNPYASVIKYPILTTVDFEYSVIDQDSSGFDLPTKCEAQYMDDFIDIKITVCNGGSLTIKKSFLSSVSYTGGDASRQSSNQTAKAQYKSYYAPTTIEPFVILPEKDECG